DALNRNLTDVGIDDRFIRDVQDKIKPGQSALFLFVREVQLDRVLPAVEPYHPEVLQTSLSPEQEARLREALSGTPPKASPVVEDRSAVPQTTAEDLAPDEAGF